MGIPIVVGVTGHRSLRTQDLSMLRAVVSAQLEKLIVSYPNSQFVMLNSIASGADTLCAMVALELGIRLICPLPMPIEEYRKDFTGTDATSFDALILQAERLFVVPDNGLSPNLTRDEHYMNSGRYIARHSCLLLALWDGMPAKPDGCGTAETVSFMLGASDEATTGCLKAANNGAVLHIYTPKQGEECELQNPSVRLLENVPGCLKNTLETIDTFNTDTRRIASDVKKTEPLITKGILSEMPEDIQQLHEVYQTSDSLSLRFQARYLHAIRYLSIFGAMLVLFFLLYDEMESNLFLILYGLLILFYVLTFVRIRKSQAHEKYLRYRMLSETLRVQFFLCAAGSNDNVADEFTWTQKQETAWIKQTISALLIGESARQSLPDETINKLWIEGQLSYHESAYRRSFGQQHIRETTANWVLAATFALFILVLVLEFTFDSAMTKTLFRKPFPPLMLYHSGQTVTLRNLMKILLGTVSAIAVFFTNYYGKLSLGRKSIDHNRMAHLYASAKEQYASQKNDYMSLFIALAREEIIEIGNWFSYSRENAPSFQI